MDKPKIIPNRPSLGKGLASLLPAASVQNQTGSSVNTNTANIDANAGLVDSNRDRHPGISMCSPDEISTNEFQPRKTFYDETIDELAQSIKNNGIVQPLIVRKSQNGYQLIAGERRLRAAKIAGLKQVPIVIRRTTDKEALELALLENIQREDLNCVELAQAYNQLIQEFDLSQEDLAERMGKDRSSIANILRLLRLPSSVQIMLKDNLLTLGHGKVLMGIEDKDKLEKLANDTIDFKWSVRELELRILKLKNLESAREQSKSTEIGSDPVALRLKNLSKDLTKKFGTKVSFKGDATKGKIQIEYYNREDLDRLLEIVLK